MGFKVSWENSTALLTKYGYRILIKPNSNTMKVNNKTITLDVRARLMNDRVMVPLRAVSESCGLYVDWNPQNRTVIISTKPIPIPSPSRLIAPDGKPYNELLPDGMYCRPEFYDSTYGHAEDLVAQSFEPLMADYLSDIEFGPDVIFPPFPEEAYLFPGFIAWDVTDYTHIPVAEMEKYFPQEKIDSIVYYETNGIEVNGERFPLDKGTPPRYE